MDCFSFAKWNNSFWCKSLLWSAFGIAHVLLVLYTVLFV